ncbi:Xanthine dehydrogenase/oxidase [Lamellibrachia satsuma]|nr:Xanthine dehydrogenase/oxidase [Lamellibrachia satsuma]
MSIVVLVKQPCPPPCAISFLATSHLAVNACLAPLCSMHGLAVTTTEAIGDTKTRLHPVQERLAKSYGSQCGFCTPGMVMSMYTLLRNNSCPSIADLDDALDGNLCRCTGYRPILDAFQSFTKEFQCPMGEQCCKHQKGTEHATSELNDGLDKTRLVFSSDRVTWYRPTSLNDLLTLKSTYPDAQLVIGNTYGLEMKLKNQQYPVVIAATGVSELFSVECTVAGLRLGASTTLTALKDVLQELISSEPEYKTRVYTAVVEMLRWIAGKHIRNVASIAGSIMSASPISDLTPLFMSARCQLTVSSKDRGQRTIVMDEEFFQGYRKTLVKPDEVLLNILIPFTRQNEYICGYKQSQRREDDMAIVNAGMRVVLSDKENVIEQLTLSFGGMSHRTIMATSTAKQLIGNWSTGSLKALFTPPPCNPHSIAKSTSAVFFRTYPPLTVARKWEGDLVPEACDLLAKELSIPPGVRGGMESYRNTLSLSFFFKFYLTVQTKRDSNQTKTTVPPSYQSATTLHKREASNGSQVFEEVESGHQQIDPVGRCLPHLAATQQTTGEAVYINDIRPYAGELSLALVISSKAHARLISVDASDALQMPGVVDFISHKDVPGENCFGCIVPDQTIFAVDKQVIDSNSFVLKIDVKWQHVFNTTKDMLSSPRVMTRFDSSKPLVLTCDASPYGVGSVLAHVMEDGAAKPTACHSRIMLHAEKNYVEINKEGSSVIVGLKKFHQYLWVAHSQSSQTTSRSFVCLEKRRQSRTSCLPS